MPFTTKPRANKRKTSSPPQYDMEELARRYLEACRILANPERASEHAAARHGIKWIQGIWAKSPDYFRWPKVRHYIGHSTLPTDDWVEVGLLKFMGYEVGAHGESTIVRRMILDDVFLRSLPRINSSDYMQAWADPQTSSRLRKLAQTVNQFAELHYKEPSKRRAVGDWLADLDYLHQKYYVPMMARLRMHWSWPQIR